MNYLWLSFLIREMDSIVSCYLHGDKSPNLIYRSPSDLEYSRIFPVENIPQIHPPLSLPRCGPQEAHFCGYVNGLHCPLIFIYVWTMKTNDKEFRGSRKRAKHIHPLVTFLSASGLSVVVFLYWSPQLPLRAIAKGLLGLVTAPFVYPFEPGSGGALPLIARLGGLHHFLLIFSELLTALWIVSSLSLFKHVFWVQHVFCVGTMTKTALDKFPKASQFRCLENWDYYLISTWVFFFFSLDAIPSINHSSLKSWGWLQMFILLYLHIRLTIKYCQSYFIII